MLVTGKMWWLDTIFLSYSSPWVNFGFLEGGNVKYLIALSPLCHVYHTTWNQLFVWVTLQSNYPTSPYLSSIIIWKDFILSPSTSMSPLPQPTHNHSSKCSIFLYHQNISMCVHTHVLDCICVACRTKCRVWFMFIRLQSPKSWYSILFISPVVPSSPAICLSIGSILY